MPDEKNVPRGGMSIRTQLVVLVLTVAIPLIVLIFGFIGLGLRREQQLSRERSRHVAESLARRLEERHRAMGVLLATVRATQQRNVTLDCSALLAGLHTSHAHLAMRLEDANGAAVCGDGQLPRNEPVLSAPLVNVEGVRVGTARVAVDTRPLLESSRDSLGGRSVAGILDPAGVVLARLPVVDTAVPNPVGERLAAGTVRDRNLDVMGVDGVQRHYGFSPVAGTRWVAFTGISANETSAAFYNFFRISIGVAAAIVFAVLMLALKLARRFVRPIVELSAAASNLTSSGSVNPVHADGPREIASLTNSFNQMVERRQEAERRLAESEQRYRTMLETSNEGVWAVDANGVTTFVNARFAEMIGYAPEEIIGRPGTDFVPPPRLQDAARLKAARQAGQAAVFEFPLCRKDGTELWVLVSATPTYRDGIFDGSFGMLTDITARHEAEVRLAESEERYRTIVDTAGEGLWLLDADMAITFANPTAQEMFGFSAEEMLGKHAMDFVSPTHLDTARRQHANRRSGRRDTFEMAFLRKDRTTIWTRITSTALMRGGEFRGAVALITDITESKLADQRLRRSEEALRQAQRDAALGSWSWNVRTSSWQVSDEYRRMLGLDDVPATATMEDFRATSHPADWPRLEGALGHALATGASAFEITARLIRRDGTFFHAWIRARIEYGPDGRAVQVHGTTQDVTQLEQTRSALEQSREELRALSDRLIVAHEEERKEIARELHDDLGQSLTAIKIDLDGLATRVTDASGQQLIERARKASLDTIRSVQRLSTNLRPVALDDLGFTAAIQQEARTFEERTGIECDVSIQNEEVVKSQRARLTLFRVTQEALTNIARHSGASRAEVRLRFDGHDVLLEIRDNGDGIPASALESPTSIGLVGMRERTSMIGGVLSVVGIPNRGTIISARFPAERME